MTPKGGTILLVLLVCGPLDASPFMKPGGRPSLQDMAKRMMRMCQNKGYPVPMMLPMTPDIINSDLPMTDGSSDQPSTFLSFFQNMLRSVSPGKDSQSRLPMGDPDKMPNMMVNCSKLTAMIKKMRNSSEAYACYMHAFVGPMSWAALTAQSDDNMESGDYKTLLGAAESALPEMPASRMNLPSYAPAQKIKKIMTMLKEVYKSMSEEQRMKVVKWGKKQIMQNNFNCTMKPSSDSEQERMRPCNASEKWLSTEALAMMGPYLSNIAPEDVDSSPKEQLCEFFRSAKFKYALTKAAKMKPSLAKRFLRRFQGCFTDQEEFLEHVDKLSTLACQYEAVRGLSPDVSKKLLYEMSDCDSRDNPRIKTMKKFLISSVMSNSTQAPPDLGSCVFLLSPEQVSQMSDDEIQDLGSSVQWSKQQQRALVRKKLGGMKCKKLSVRELMALQSVAPAVPSCVLKLVQGRAMLDDREAMENISRKMRKTQLTAMLQGLSEEANPSELLQKLTGPLRQMVSLSFLDKVNVTSLDKSNKTWTRPQAAYLAKKMFDQRKLQFRKLHSLLQGVTCKMIDNVTDGDVPEMAWAITDNERWLSKVQAKCAARKLFMSLEKKREDYFKSITEDELDEIPTVFLIHLPPQQVLDLPDSVCPVFLDKMEMANLSMLPRRAPSRLALSRKALLCLTKGTDLSSLTSEDVSRLGPLLCEVQPSQLSLMSTDVLTSSLKAMASCQHIPSRHRVDLMQLVIRTSGNPSDWSPETMEQLGPIILMDDDVTSALPNKPWMKGVLAFLKPRLWRISEALRKKLFSLTTTSTSNFTITDNSNNTEIHTSTSDSNISMNVSSVNVTISSGARRKRTVRSSDGKGHGNSGSSSNTISSAVPTVELIEDLGMENVYWTAAQLDQMSVDTFRSTVDTLGEVTDYSAAQLAVLSKKAAEAYGSELHSESLVTRLGCITRGFSSAQLEQSQFSLDDLEDIAGCGWNKSQMAAVWKAATAYNNLTGAQELGAVEMVGLNRFICGLSSSEISQLNVDAFKDAVGSMNLLCSYEDLQRFKGLAVSAFGDPRTWTTAQVSDLRNIIAGLNPTELVSLDPSVFPYVSECCIPLIPPENFAALSAAQLEALGPDNAAMLTIDQRAALTDEQREALERAEIGSRSEEAEPVPAESGAPSLSVEGLSAFMMPALFLLTGFLLL